MLWSEEIKGKSELGGSYITSSHTGQGESRNVETLSSESGPKRSSDMRLPMLATDRHTRVVRLPRPHRNLCPLCAKCEPLNEARDRERITPGKFARRARTDGKVFLNYERYRGEQPPRYRGTLTFCNPAGHEITTAVRVSWMQQ